MILGRPFNNLELPDQFRLQPQCRMSDYAASGVARVVLTASSIPLFRHNQTEYAPTQSCPFAHVSKRCPTTRDPLSQKRRFDCPRGLLNCFWFAVNEDLAQRCRVAPATARGRVRRRPSRHRQSARPALAGIPESQSSVATGVLEMRIALWQRNRSPKSSAGFRKRNPVVLQRKLFCAHARVVTAQQLIGIKHVRHTVRTEG